MHCCIDHYNTPEKVDELLALGDLSVLNIKLNPDPSRPHSFDYKERQKDVTVAYGRDRGEKDTESEIMTLAKLDDQNNWTEYVYIFTQNNEWKYFRSGHSQEGLRDVKEDLDAQYAAYNLTRTEGYYGLLSDGIAEEIRQEQATDQENDLFTMKME